MEKITHSNTATAIHLTSLMQYFIPFGNFIFPIIIWASAKDQSEFVDEQGKQVINFQLSLFMYSMILALITIPIALFLIFNGSNFSFNQDSNFLIENFNFAEMSGGIIIAVIAVLIFFSMKAAEFFLIIYAAIKTSQENHFKYPFIINFLK